MSTENENVATESVNSGEDNTGSRAENFGGLSDSDEDGESPSSRKSTEQRTWDADDDDSHSNIGTSQADISDEIGSKVGDHSAPSSRNLSFSNHLNSSLSENPKNWLSGCEKINVWINSVVKAAKDAAANAEPTMSFSKLHRTKAPAVSEDVHISQLEEKVWEHLTSVPLDLLWMVDYASLKIRTWFQALGLKSKIAGQLEVCHRELIDPIWEAAFCIANADENSGEFECTSEQEITWKSLKGPLDYAFKRSAKKGAERLTCFCIEAKRYDKYYKQAFNQLSWQLVALRGLANISEQESYQPVCGVASDGIRYQFVVLGRTMFFSSVQFGVLELKDLYVASDKDTLEWISSKDLIHIMAGMMLGRFPDQIREGCSELFVRLLEKDVKEEEEINWDADELKDARGMYPLHYAARSSGGIELIRFLSDKGHPLHCRDLMGYTPLRWAAYKKNKDAFLELLKFETKETLPRKENDQTLFDLLFGMDEEDGVNFVSDVLEKIFPVVSERLPYFVHFDGGSVDEGWFVRYARDWIARQEWEKFKFLEDKDVRQMFGISLEGEVVCSQTAIKYGLNWNADLKHLCLEGMDPGDRVFKSDVIAEEVLKDLSNKENWKRLIVISKVFPEDYLKRARSKEEKAPYVVGARLCLSARELEGGLEEEELRKKGRSTAEKKFYGMLTKAKSDLAETKKEKK